MADYPTVFTETAAELSQQLKEAAVDHAAFEQMLPICELSKCRATCCHDGVILSSEEADIMSFLGAGDKTPRRLVWAY